MRRLTGMNTPQSEGTTRWPSIRYSRHDRLPGGRAAARQFVFHPTQTVEDEPDGSLLVRFQASGHVEMYWHLYSWGRSIDVLQPARLREMVHGHRRDFPALP